MTTLKRLYNRFKTQTEEIEELKISVDEVHERLSKKLSRKQRRLLLRIIDDKDLIRELSSFHCFEQGFKLGIKMGAEIYFDEDADTYEIVDGIIMG